MVIFSANAESARPAPKRGGAVLTGSGRDHVAVAQMPAYAIPGIAGQKYSTNGKYRQMNPPRLAARWLAAPWPQRPSGAGSRCALWARGRAVPHQPPTGAELALSDADLWLGPSLAGADRFDPGLDHRSLLDRFTIRRRRMPMARLWQLSSLWSGRFISGGASAGPLRQGDQTHQRRQRQSQAPGDISHVPSQASCGTSVPCASRPCLTLAPRQGRECETSRCDA